MPYKPKKRICQNCGKEFVIEPEDFEFYQEIGVPEPTFCPDCRLQRRLAFRNERKLYKRKCDLCGKDIISVYHKDVPFPVYCQKCWWSDKWDPMEYGRDYDFNKPFFEQFRDLIRDVPRKSLEQESNENSPFTHYTWHSKNCYLSPSTLYSEDILYSKSVDKCYDCIDCNLLTESDLCYQCLESNKCYNCTHLIKCRNCMDSHFLYDCNNCQNCFLCFNLRNKQYYILNKPYTKEDYLRKLNEFFTGSYSKIIELSRKFKNIAQTKAIHKFANIVKSVDCSGDNIRNSKKAINCFDVYNLENVKNCVRVYDMKDSMDVYGCDKAELSYESITIGFKASRIKFCTNTDTGVGDLEYCDSCHSSSNLFGCIGLRHKQYCILNKQYTKEEYERLVPKIIEQMNKIPYVDKKGRVYKYGEFFPIELSPFSYNETVAQEYFPLTEEEAIKQGYSWYKRPKSEYKPTIKAEDLPDNIKDVDDSILNEIIECKNAKSMASEGVAERSSASSRSSASLLQKGSLSKNKTLNMCTGSGVYRILPQELEFYRKMNLPLPRLCPDCRHYERIKQRNPLKLYKRKCDKCGKEILTIYSPDRPEIVYCEACYLKEIG